MIMLGSAIKHGCYNDRIDNAKDETRWKKLHLPNHYRIIVKSSEKKSLTTSTP